jgi:hypothetical protein
MHRIGVGDADLSATIVVRSLVDLEAGAFDRLVTAG